MSSRNNIYDRPEELLQNLIRFDTTNPPGHESECIGYVDGLLTQAGFETVRLSRDADRPNLITRLPGRGEAPPLLFYGHVDVVSTAGQAWTHPPFGGEIDEGYVWGRGALDMKGGIAMMLATLLRAKDQGMVPKGDIVLAVLSDEEAGGDYGAKYLVEQHPEQFAGIRYAVGEFGGFPLYFGGKKFYAIQVAEKQICWLQTRLHGPAGHGSMPMHGGAMSKLAQVLQKLDTQRLPVHVTPPMRQMLETMAAAVPPPANAILAQLLEPARTDAVLDQLGVQGNLFSALLHNTVNATIVQGGDKVNVIPSEVVLQLDGRMLPGFTCDELIAEIRQVVGEEVEFEVILGDSGPASIDMGLFDRLAGILRQADPEIMVIPLLLPGSTDGRFLSQLGIQSYGFIPMNLPADFNFIQSIHAADERVPVEALRFGAQALGRLVEQYGT